ncbi:L-threonylcarbamoyladenylate synthase [Aquibacillus koreensis]|uniref:Threonylcarbamoyl-AMP synthase n=1 Tax=Aquibacillus koreensis TaxID=279446 RepID=A0A9X4AIH9_9BACI|nr:L-threonylcarbamoyladenylate synthase [Aquibacillus koreensis]MCT2538298.1 L-threonylcarbamoyladenylate synthase [Aquibacillus koreensis]MDC3420759.1 L-threonylcarbamoyladenylate synthase [Aquibacillus koreensis]
MGKETMYWKINEHLQKSEHAMKEAAMLLNKQEVVAFPTETVYGLGANALSEEAVSKIFEAKGRPSDNPLIVHVADESEIENYVTEIPTVAKKLIRAFMPGPLTVILHSNGKIARNVTAGLDTVGVRIPDHPVALELLRTANLPLAAPSANVSGKPSPTKAEHVRHDLDGKVAGILDGGTTGVGLESTVIDCTAKIPIVLRPGGITIEQLQQVVGDVMVDPALIQAKDQPKAPGMKYNHYEPDAPLWLIQGDIDFFKEQINLVKEQGKKVGVMASKELVQLVEADLIKPCGSREDLKEVAVHLYDTLRAFKKADVDVILCEAFPTTGVGQAIMNRLEKAASRKIVQDS